ncbi:MobF family relaxase [Streptomyces zhihengii]
MHPDAEEIVARELGAGVSLTRAMKSAKLGPAVPRLTELSPLDEKIEQALEHVSGQLCRPLSKAETRDVRMGCAARAFKAEFRRDPADGAEVGRYLATRTGPRRRAVTGYDLTFSSEELSLLFALGGPEVRRIALEVLAQARSETLAWLERNALAVRTGAGGVAQQRAEPGLLAAIYLHYESRAGDPMLHEHAVISPRVKGPDGRWRNLDSRLLFRDIVVASELFNQRALELACTRLGLATEEVEVTPGQRPEMHIVGIDRRLRSIFAQRSHAVRTMAESLFDDYRRSHGRERAWAAPDPGAGAGRREDPPAQTPCTLPGRSAHRLAAPGDRGHRPRHRRQPARHGPLCRAGTARPGGTRHRRSSRCRPGSRD